MFTNVSDVGRERFLKSGLGEVIKFNIMSGEKGIRRYRKIIYPNYFKETYVLLTILLKKSLLFKKILLRKMNLIGEKE